MNPRWHPLWRLAQQPWWVVVLLFIVLGALDLGLGLAAAGRKPLRDAASLGTLEVCPSKAEETLQAWRQVEVKELRAGGLDLAVEAVTWDYAFIAGYTVALCVACLAFVRRGGWFERWGARFGWLALLMGALDVLENVGLLQMIERKQRGEALG